MTRRLPFSMSLALISALAFVLGCPGGDPNEDPEDTMEHASLLMADVEREASTTNDATLAELVSDKTSFAVWMYHQGVAANGADDNFIYSPLSISTAFAMLWAGAVGDTADEIAAMLHFGLDPQRFHPAANRLDRELTSRGDYVPAAGEGDAPILEIVNDLWGLDDYPYQDAFLDLLARHYGAGMWIVDFVGFPEEARQEINAYIARHTRDLIPELLPEGSITELTRLVLTNAIYFKGAWSFPFDEANTEDGLFTAIDGSTAMVPMMTGAIDGAHHAAVNGAELVELSYVGDDLSMVLILPDDGTFATFEAALDASSIESMIAELTAAEGRLTMPRFEFDSELSLRGIFEAAGYTNPFTSGVADFSGLSEVAIEEGLHVSGVFHKAAIVVDEEGTEAAAATAIVVDGRTGTGDGFEMSLDRPFLFVIRDRPTGAILFIGRVVDAADAQP